MGLGKNDPIAYWAMLGKKYFAQTFIFLPQHILKYSHSTLIQL
jgi:hypothetical protein